jgi:diguanylate cyclase (GGDEF)-like protein
MGNQSELAMTFSREGEVIITFPDGLRHPTGLFPNPSDQEVTRAFFDTTIGKTIIMQLRAREIHDKKTRLHLQEPARSIIEQNIARLSEMKFDGVVSVLMLDLDHFGRVNKKHGQDAGDQVLRWFGDILRRSTRNNDVLARWGGEEFVVFAAANKPSETQTNRHRDRPWSETARIATGTTLSNPDQLMSNGKLIGSRIHTTTETTACQIGNISIKQTVTIGVASAYLKPDSDIDRLFDRLFLLASETMYRGKQEDRRNHVHVAPMIYVNPKTF